MSVGGIAGASMAMAQANVMDKVGIAVMDMAMETMETNSDMMVQSMQHMAQPHLGGNVDMGV